MEPLRNRTSHHHSFTDRRCPRKHALDEAMLDDFDRLVQSASLGDAYAVAALGIALGPELVAFTRELAGDVGEADRLLADFFDMLLLGHRPFRPRGRRALAWIEKVIAGMARERTSIADVLEDDGVDDDELDHHLDLDLENENENENDDTVEVIIH